MRCLDITGAVIGYNDLRDLKKETTSKGSSPWVHPAKCCTSVSEQWFGCGRRSKSAEHSLPGSPRTVSAERPDEGGAS